MITVKSTRELDALVAEHIFKLPIKWFRWGSPPYDNSSEGVTPWVKGYEMGAGYNWAECPVYTTWEGMEEVINYLISKDYRWDLSGVKNRTSAFILPDDYDSPGYDATASTAPIALCLAALKSVGIDVEYVEE